MIKIKLLVAFQSDMGLKSVSSATKLCRSAVDVSVVLVPCAKYEAL